MTTVAEKTNGEVLTTAQRWVELIFVVAILALLGYFAIHQATHTGFFTDEFGSLEMVLFYGSLLFSIAPPVTRALTGRRNPARLLEIASTLLSAIVGLWFLISFPFDFSHFADVLPEAIRFILAWITNDLGKIPLVLMVIAAPFSAFSTAKTYLSVRGKAPVNPSQQRTS